MATNVFFWELICPLQEPLFNLKAISSAAWGQNSLVRAYENDYTTHAKISFNYILGIQFFALLIEIYQAPEGRLATVRKLHPMESFSVVRILNKRFDVLSKMLTFCTFLGCHFKRPSVQKWTSSRGLEHLIAVLFISELSITFASP